LQIFILTKGEPCQRNLEKKGVWLWLKRATILWRVKSKSDRANQCDWLGSEVMKGLYCLPQLSCRERSVRDIFIWWAGPCRWLVAMLHLVKMSNPSGTFFSLSFLSSGLLFNQKIEGLLLFSCQMETRNSHGHHISQLLSLSLISLGSFFLLPVYSLIQFFFFKGYLIVLHACPIGLVPWTMAALWVDTNASKNVLLTVGYCNMIIHGYYPSLCSCSLDLSLLLQLFVNCWMTNLKWSFHFQ